MKFTFFLTLITIFYTTKNLKIVAAYEKCEKNHTREIRNQLEAVEEIEIENFHTLWILTNNDLDKYEKFIQHLTGNHSIDFVSRSENKSYLSLIKENVLLYSRYETNTRIGYLLHRALNETKENELLLKYFIKKQMDKVSKVNVLKNSHSANYFVSLINNIYEGALKNSTVDNINKTEIDLWTKFFMKGLLNNEKTFLNLNFTTELKISQEMNCSMIAINDYLTVSSHQLADYIFNHYFNLEENSTNEENFIKELTNAHVILNAAVDKFQVTDGKNILDTENFEPFISAFSELNISVPEDYFLQIAMKINQMNFLYLATGTRRKANFVLDPVKKIIMNEIGASILWYQKLQIAYIAASRSLSNNLHSKMRKNANQLSEHFSFKALNSKIKERELKILEHHLFNRDLKKECILMNENTENEIYKLEIHGDFLTFKDIPDIDLCRGKTRYIQVFARNVVTIDKNLIRIGDMMQIVVIAPKWIVSNSRWIDLRGADGEDYEISAEDGQLGMRGEDGLPGLPGGSGGIFIGIADEIINKENLQIFADGGLGGTGQNGGKGGKGPDTRIPTIDDYDKSILFETKERRYFPFFEEMDDICLVYNIDLLTISSGGDGGNGGKGGHGGNAGKIFLIQTNQQFQDEHLPKAGETGYDGQGGFGGPGNFKRESIEEYCSTEITDSVKCENCTITERLELVIHNGTPGQDGSNTKNMKHPFDFLGFRTIAFVVNDYKTYARVHLKKNQGLSKFYANLLENEMINKQYSTFGLLDELKGLERQHLELEIVDLLPMYDNLQKRIQNYVQHRLDSEMSDDYFVALDYAYTAILTKVSRLIDNGYFVHHLENYVESVSRNIDTLKDNIIQYTANQLGEDYKQNIERRIKEARIIIEEQLYTAINKGQHLMKEKIYHLINETIVLRNESQEKNNALKKAIMQQTIFTILKSALVGISAFIPGGQAAAIVAFTALHIGESFAPEYPDERFKTRIPTAVGNRFAGALEFVKNAKLKQQQQEKQEKEKQQKDIEFLRNEKNLETEFANWMLEQTSEGKLDVGTNIVNEIEDLDKDIETLVQKEENEDDTDYTKVLDIVGKLKAYYNFKQKNTDAVEQLEDDIEKKETLKDNIASTENDIEKLQKYENRIYNELIPVFEKMQQDLPSDETLRIQSVAALDISKWNVQMALKNVKLIFKQFTKGFNTETELNLIIENLEDTINTLISIYDQIQNFQQEKKLAAYIKQLTSNKFQIFSSENKQLENSVLETRFIIRINLVLIQYKKIYNAFKQFVFPFVNKYMKDLHKPFVFESSTNITLETNWFAKISENVDKIKNKINAIQATIFKNSKFNEKLEYGNKHQGEIYLWQNETHYEMISNLLEGKEVILFPNARNFPHFAVKFKKIRIGFVAKNKTEQKHLTELLNPLEMKMTHEGNSYYKCGNKLYLISHSPITLIKTFNESYQGESDSVQKLASGDDLVSPFATWRVKISRSTGDIEENYFRKFKNKVDLVLEGICTYVQVTDTDVCHNDTKLSEYYEEYIPIMDFVK